MHTTENQPDPIKQVSLDDLDDSDYHYPRFEYCNCSTKDLYSVKDAWHASDLLAMTCDRGLNFDGKITSYSGSAFAFAATWGQVQEMGRTCKREIIWQAMRELNASCFEKSKGKGYIGYATQPHIGIDIGVFDRDELTDHPGC